MSKIKKRRLKVLFVSAEVAPYSFVGGLSQVSYFLPQALNKRGVDIRIFTPKYGTLDEEKFPTRTLIKGLNVATGESSKGRFPTHLICNVKILKKPVKGDPFVYFLENMEYFEKRANVYGYSDDHIRFALLSRGVLEFIRRGEFIPDIIHVNDWHTAYTVNYIKDNYKNDPRIKKLASLLSIHNIYQGNFDFKNVSEMDYDDGRSHLASFFNERLVKQNALRRGVINADAVNTVSDTYAHELLTEEYGGNLYKLFRELRGKLFGVLNGLDYKDFNPNTDTIIKKRFNSKTIVNRIKNKTDLQKEFRLTTDLEIPILGLSGRMGSQKGIELIMEVIDFILTELNVQLVVLGTGEGKYINFFSQLEKKYPGRVGAHLMADFVLPRKIFAGADILLIPSKYEPGGIVAVEAMRYGCVPVVRATGGLADTVIDYDPATNSGTGFSFKEYEPKSFLVALVRALENYKNKKIWKEITIRAMKQDFSWDKAAEEYLDLYERTKKLRKASLASTPTMAFRQTRKYK